MNRRLICWLVCTVVVLANDTGFSADPMVQEFDGWKITIQPGDFAVASGARDHVPPAPSEISAYSSSKAQSIVRLASLEQNEAIDLPRPSESAPGPGDDGLPLIVPGECCDKVGVVSVDPPAGRVDPRYLSQMYYEVYKSIPFIRAEYNASPSYIHDATMEFLFGQMRPTVIHRGSTSVYHNYPDYGYGYGFNGYAYPPLQLVIPGVGLRIHRN